MRKMKWLAVLGLGVLLGGASAVRAQVRPYIGMVYPAGGQQGTTIQIRLGGQGMDYVYAVLVSGFGVTAKVVEYDRRLNNQEQALITEQLRELKHAIKEAARAKHSPRAAGTPLNTTPGAGATNALIARLESRVADFVQLPANASIATLVQVEIRIAPNAPPGEREIRMVTTRGVSNPLPFYVGQEPEYTRKPMRTASKQILGKEELALRKRPADEVEDHVTIPCALNGQIASGEKNLYRFTARAGQRLVITSLARQLIPYIADAVPGWFQPVMVLYDAKGKEVAYDDDYRFKPDPVIWYEVPKTSEYVLAIYDAIYRGREDFVYRINIGELPFVTSIFPLGGRAGVPATITMKGWNLVGSDMAPPPTNTPPGITSVVAHRGKLLSNPVPFMLDTLPECFKQGRNNTIAHAQKVTLPIIINGRIDRSDDWDTYQFTGKSNQIVVAEVYARRLDSPLDSVLKLTDANGKLLAYNDDCEDFRCGLSTYHADSYFKVKLPADGQYYVHISDITSKGGEAYAYRLRISDPRPDFSLRVVPSSVSLRNKGYGSLNIYALRRDGFTNTVQLVLKDPPAGFTARPVLLKGTQPDVRFTFKTDLVVTQKLVKLAIAGSAMVGGQEISHAAVPAEDRMQAFLWRHLVPAKDLMALVFDPNYELPPQHVVPVRPPPAVVTNVVAFTTNVTAGVTNIVAATKGKFTKQQVAARIRELKRLYEEGLLLDDFYSKRMDECEVSIENMPPPASTNAPAKPKVAVTTLPAHPPAKVGILARSGKGGR